MPFLLLFLFPTPSLCFGYAPFIYLFVHLYWGRILFLFHGYSSFSLWDIWHLFYLYFFNIIFFLFILFSIFQVQGFPQTSQSLYPEMFKSDTLEHWLEALSIWEMLIWFELLCRSIGMGSLKGKLQISISFQCHIFHHRLVIFPRKDSSSVLPRRKV